MTVVAERPLQTITAEAPCYEVQCPDTGEILAYVTTGLWGLPRPLGEVLQEHGFRLVPAHSGPSDSRKNDLLP